MFTIRPKFLFKNSKKLINLQTHQKFKHKLKKIQKIFHCTNGNGREDSDWPNRSKTASSLDNKTAPGQKKAIIDV